MKHSAKSGPGTGSSDDLFLRKIPVLLLLLAAVLRALQLSVELQYDELWTLINFTQLDTFKILTDLSLPNNHPVNTLVLKLLSQISLAPVILRLGVFLCGIMVVYLTGECAKLLSSDREYPLAAQFLAALSLPLIYFSVYARGYMFQLAGLQLCILGMYRSATNDNDRAAPFMIATGGILCCFSVSSGIMFLLCAAVGHLLLAPEECRFKKKFLISTIVTAIILLIYYAALYTRIRAGQHWGIEITSLSVWLTFAARTVSALLPLFLIPWVAAGSIFDRRCRIIMLTALLPLLLAVVTNGGPERVYLPLAVVFILIAAGGFNALRKKFPQHKKILMMLLVLSGIGSWCVPEPVWQLQTPAADLRKSLTATPENTLVALPGTAGFPAAMNAPELAQLAEQRAAMPAAALVMLHCDEGKFNGSDNSFGEVEMRFPVRGKRLNILPGYSYALTRCETPPPGTTVLVQFFDAPSEEFVKYSGKKIRLNLWLNKRCQLYICEVPPQGLPVVNGICYRIGESVP
ncbi:MAG: hypothetical protein IKC89_07710 [Lentisphaeria bacterium]|nr:hypothetical protein [Lentisphaeria bacterium]